MPEALAGDWRLQRLGRGLTCGARYLGIAANHSLADCYLDALQRP